MVKIYPVLVLWRVFSEIKYVIEIDLWNVSCINYCVLWGWVMLRLPCYVFWSCGSVHWSLQRFNPLWDRVSSPVCRPIYNRNIYINSKSVNIFNIRLCLSYIAIHCFFPVVSTDVQTGVQSLLVSFNNCSSSSQHERDSGQDLKVGLNPVTWAQKPNIGQ